MRTPAGMAGRDVSADCASPRSPSLDRQTWPKAIRGSDLYHFNASSASDEDTAATSLNAVSCEPEGMGAPEAVAHFDKKSVQLDGCSSSGFVLIRPKLRNVSSIREKPLYLHGPISRALRDTLRRATYRKVPLKRSFSPSTSPRPYFSA